MIILLIIFIIILVDCFIILHYINLQYDPKVEGQEWHKKLIKCGVLRNDEIWTAVLLEFFIDSREGFDEFF